MTEQPKLTPEQIDSAMAWADGAMGAAGHRVSDPQARDTMRDYLAGKLTIEQAVLAIKDA